ncbi:MAG: LptF/LptG family permease [Ignavibacteria bacterium]|nr:LptF/LptG family permease [Ignavibacteria bacterium]MBT8380866.1 LptF/LptG family permease [Ignavibacteria bacterium]MBT8391147.1 LptF/LptG family permease [Ignavibacteria bacterium]NNJ54270.1 YjgP/YjgQ family permease [Ignavibacteriaceae bacterium]NNL20235.1 YjgP/YjgQ family permease [Ignavibacteriaceae bacterium]
MKILDRYLIRLFLQTVFFAVLAFTLVFVVIDAMENLDDFIDQGVPQMKILHYYLVFIPEIIKLMTPVSVLFGALFTAGKLSSLSELTAIRASGVSLFRFMAPFIITALIISIVSVYFGGYVVPMANKTKVYIEQFYLKKGMIYTGSNIYFQDTKSKIVSISFFDSNTNRANKISIQSFDDKDRTKMIDRIDAQKLEYDSLSNVWVAYNGVRRTFLNDRENAEYFSDIKLEDLNFRPKDLSKKQQKPQEMNLDELSELIDTQKRAGNDPTIAQIEYHSRYAFAVTSLIIVLFGLPISVNKKKSGLAVQVGINLLITFVYLVFMKVSQAFGKNGALDPVLTAWFANFIFLAGTAITLPKMKY